MNGHEELTPAEVLEAAQHRWGRQIVLIGPNPGKPEFRWLLGATQGVVSSTLGVGETPEKAFLAAKETMAAREAK